MAEYGWSFLLVVLIQTLGSVKSEDSLLPEINYSNVSYYQLSALTIVTIGLVCAAITLAAGTICITCLKVDRRPIKYQYHVRTRRHADRRPVHTSATNVVYVASPPQQPHPQYVLTTGRHSPQVYNHYFPRDTRAVKHYTNSSVHSHNTSLVSSHSRHSATNGRQYHNIENAHPPKTRVSLKEYETHSLTMSVPEEEEDVIVLRPNGNKI